MKVYNTQPVSLTINVWLIKIVLFFDHWSNHLFQSNKHFQAIEFMDWPIQEKLEKLSSWCNSYPQFPQSPLGMRGTKISLLAHTKGKKKKKKETLAFLESWS